MRGELRKLLDAVMEAGLSPDDAEAERVLAACEALVRPVR